VAAQPELEWGGVRVEVERLDDAMRLVEVPEQRLRAVDHLVVELIGHPAGPPPVLGQSALGSNVSSILTRRVHHQNRVVDGRSGGSEAVTARR
jgi:hypothetical protein